MFSNELFSIQFTCENGETQKLLDTDIVVNVTKQNGILFIYSYEIFRF